MSATWANVYAQVNVVVQPAPITVNPFGIPAFCSTDTDFGGDAFRTYSSVDAINADADLSTSAKAALTSMLSAVVKPSSVACIPVAAGGTPYPTALAAAENAGLHFVYVTIQSRTAADIVIVSNWCEARNYILLAQSADSSWLNAGVPSGFSTITDNAQTGVVYHPTDTQYADCEWAGFAAAVNPNDGQRYDFVGPIGSVTSYDLTDAQRDAALANYCNVITPYTPRGTIRAIGKGYALSGEHLYAAEVRIWTYDAILAAIMSTVEAYQIGGQSIPKNADGEAIVSADLQRVGAAGLANGCFTKSAALPDGYRISVTITGDNIVATVTYGLLDTVDKVIVNASLSRV